MTESLNNVSKRFIYGFILLLLCYYISDNNKYISYFIADISLLFFLKNNKNAKYSVIGFDFLLLFLFSFFNSYLIVRLLYDHEGYNIIQCLFNPFLIPSTLVLFLIYQDFDLKTFKYIISKSLIAILLTIPLTIYNPMRGINLMQMILPFYIMYLIENGNWKRHILILAYIVGAIYWFVFVDENRTSFFFIILYIFSFIIVHRFPYLKKALFKAYLGICIVFPIALFVFGISLFDISTYSNTDNESTLYADTRTFLYFETVDTLLDEESLFTGLGLNGRIYTQLQDFVDLSVDNKGRRKFLEGGLLEYMKRGGLLYLLLYTLVLIVPSYRLINEDSKLLNMIGFYILSSYVLSLIGVTPNVRLDYVMLILCCSMGYNNNVLTEEKDRL